MTPGVDDLALMVRVHGIPAPQGSKKYVGNGRMIESSKKVGPWREAVKAAILTATGHKPTTLDGAVQVDITFILPRPKGHYGTRSEEHTSELQSRPHLVCRLLLEKKKLPC